MAPARPATEGDGCDMCRPLLGWRWPMMSRHLWLDPDVPRSRNGLRHALAELLTLYQDLPSTELGAILQQVLDGGSARYRVGDLVACCRTGSTERYYARIDGVRDADDKGRIDWDTTDHRGMRAAFRNTPEAVFERRLSREQWTALAAVGFRHDYLSVFRAAGISEGEPTR